MRFEGDGEDRHLVEAVDYPCTHTRVSIVREGSPRATRGDEFRVEPGIYIQALRHVPGSSDLNPVKTEVVAMIVLPRDGDGAITLDEDNEKIDSWYWPIKRREEYENTTKQAAG